MQQSTPPTLTVFRLLPFDPDPPPFPESPPLESFSSQIKNVTTRGEKLQWVVIVFLKKEVIDLVLPKWFWGRLASWEMAVVKTWGKTVERGVRELGEELVLELELEGGV